MPKPFDLEEKKDDWGFTLLELMIVLSVISILAIVAVPQYTAVKENYRLEQAAQIVVSQLDYARQMAMDKRETMYVVLQEEQVGVYRVEGSSLELLDSQPYQGGVIFDSADNSWIPEVYADITNGQLLGKGLSYNFRGFLTGQYYGVIELQSRTGQTTCISIAEHTGKIAVGVCTNQSAGGGGDNDPDSGGDDDGYDDCSQWQAQAYQGGDCVTYNGRTFVARYYASANQVPGVLYTPWQEITDEWRNFNVYYAGDVVTYNGSQFEARNWTQNQEPGLLNSPWQEATNEWRFFNEYEEGDEVLYNGQRYRAKWYSKNEQPGGSDVWELVS